MKTLTFAALAAACIFTLPTMASAQTAQVIYQDTNTAGLNASAPGVSYLQLFTPTVTGSYTVSAMTFGYGVAAGTTAQTGTVFFDFYSNLNTSSTAADALGGSTYLGGFGVTLTIAANTGTTVAGRAATVGGLTGVSPPISLTLNGSSFGVVATFANAAGTNYSSVIGGLFTTGAPTVGTSAGYVWLDSNFNGGFAGTEKTTSPTNAYLSISAIPNVVAVPEPATWGMMIAGFGLVGATMRRRQRVAVRVSYAA